jgi:hypothetical protein|nr:MAG TPA: delta-sleep-inducing peptide [Caudoviricetes sp.]
MDDKEYTYDIDKYTIGVDTNGEDGIGMTVVKIENGELYFLGNCYGENARCIDLLIKENQELKKQLEEYKAINKVLSQELTKDKILKQDHLTTCCGISIVDIPKLITQQKEFIKYLEEKEKQFDGADPRLAGACSGILQKYKEIIGEIK